MFESGKIRTELVWTGKRKSLEKLPRLPFQTVEMVNEPREKTLDLYSPVEESGHNLLIWGDNKLVMNSLLKNFEGKINLIYIDPPFATGADFRMPIRIDGERFVKQPSGIEIKAYRDIWGEGLASYLQMIYDRLILMKKLLDPENGSIFVHMDWHVGHYVKLIMDELFGKENFRNDIIWWYPGGLKAVPKFFPRKHDNIIFYTKSDDYLFNVQRRSPKESSLWSRWAKYTRDGKTVLFKDFPKSDEVKLADYTKRFIVRHGRAPKPNDVIYEFEGPLVDSVWGDCPAVFRLLNEKLFFPTQKPEKLLERIIKTSSNKGDIVADFFCGSGTTLAVAEKLGRRWIGCDLSKYAIHVTRKRLLEIPGCMPFKILNLGFYQKHKLRENGVKDYKDFILRLYEASPISGYGYIHGRRGRRPIHIGAPDSFVTEREIKRALQECKSANSTGLDVLGWEFEMGLYELIQDLGEEYGVDVKLKQIPIDVLDMRERELANVKFFDLNYLDMDATVEERKVTVEVNRFAIANPEYMPEKIRDSIEDFRSYIDYWAIDFDYKDDVFHNMRQEYRTRKNQNLRTIISYEYKNPGEYDVLVKVVDLFGNDTNKIAHVKVK